MPERGKSRFATVSSTYIRLRGGDGKRRLVASFASSEYDPANRHGAVADFGRIAMGIRSSGMLLAVVATVFAIAPGSALAQFNMPGFGGGGATSSERMGGGGGGKGATTVKSSKSNTSDRMGGGGGAKAGGAAANRMGGGGGKGSASRGRNLNTSRSN
jgi:hypothetical protein